MGGKPQNYSQNPTNAMMAGTSPFAAQYAQPGSFGTKGIGDGRGGGSGGDDPLAIEDPNWGDHGVEDPFAPAPVVQLEDPTKLPVGDGPFAPAPEPIPKPVPPGTPIGSSPPMMPNYDYTPLWMQQFLAGMGGGTSGSTGTGGTGGTSGVAGNTSGTNQGSTGTSGTF